MRFVTKATPIGYIDSKCHIKRLKSSKTYLIGFQDSHHATSYSWSRGWTHTHTHIHTNTHTDVRTKVISRNQARAGLRWFNKTQCLFVRQPDANNFLTIRPQLLFCTPNRFISGQGRCPGRLCHVPNVRFRVWYRFWLLYDIKHNCYQI